MNSSILIHFASNFSESILISSVSNYLEGILAGFVSDFSEGILAASRVIWSTQLTKSETFSPFLKVAQLPFALFHSFDINLKVCELFILFCSLSTGGCFMCTYCTIFSSITSPWCLVLLVLVYLVSTLF